MKHTIFTLLLIFSSVASAQMSVRRFQSLNSKQKIQVMEAYREFFRDDSTPLESIVGIEKRFFDLIEEAYAAPTFNCFYAGWPSVKKRAQNRVFCANPKGNNPDYSQGPCGGDELQCEVTLFGSGLCFSVSTQAQRNSAFSQCEKKFESAGRKIDEVLQNTSSQKLDELFQTVNQVCKTSSAPGICRRLEARLALIDKDKSVKPEAPKVEPARITKKDEAKNLSTSYTKLVTAIKKPEPDCDDTSSPATEKITIASTTASGLNCPNPAQIRSLKAMILQNALAVASLMCENDWYNRPSVKAYISSRPDIFYGEPSKRDISLSLYNLFSNRVLKQGLQANYLSYYEGLFGKRQHVSDSVATYMVNSIQTKLNQNTLSCGDLGDALSSALTASDNEFLPTIEKSELVNRSDVWEMVLKPVRDQKGLGECQVFQTSKN